MYEKIQLMVSTSLSIFTTGKNNFRLWDVVTENVYIGEKCNYPVVASQAGYRYVLLWDEIFHLNV